MHGSWLSFLPTCLFIAATDFETQQQVYERKGEPHFAAFFHCDAKSETIIYQAGLRTYINQVPIGHGIHSVSDTQSVNYTFILVKLF